MANEEKKINIRLDADASGLNQAAREAKENFRSAFDEISDYDILSNADKAFEKTEERVEAIKKKLEEMRKEMHDSIDDSRGGNAFGKAKIRNEEGNKIDTQFNELVKRFERYVKALEKHNQQTGSSGGGFDPMKGYDKYKDKMTPEQYSAWMQKQHDQKAQNMMRMQDEKNSPSALARMGAQSLQGNGAGALQTGAQSVLGGFGLGAGGMLLGGAIVGALIMGFKKLFDEGLKLSRAESRSNMLVENKFSGFTGDYNDRDTGLSNSDLVGSGVRVAKSRGFGGENLAMDARNRKYLENAYSLSEGETGGLDRFYKYDKPESRRDGSMIIADLLLRSEKNGILGVSGNDFSRLPEKIASIGDILSMQRGNSERVDSNFATSMVVAGDKIGGRFGDDRLGESMGRIDSSIKNPGNAGMRSYIFQMLQRANPGSSYTDIMGQMENGASGDNLKAILPNIAQMQQGEMRRIVLYQLTKNWQDAIRLDASGNLNEMMKATNGMKSSKGDIDEKFNQVKTRSGEGLTNLDQWQNTIESAIEKAGGVLIGRLGLGTKEQNDVNNINKIKMDIGPGVMGSPYTSAIKTLFGFNSTKK